jgi:hypothetical protein
MHATCLAHLILDFVTILMYREEYKLWSFSSYSFLHPPVTSSFLGLNILLSALFSIHIPVG